MEFKGVIVERDSDYFLSDDYYKDTLTQLLRELKKELPKGTVIKTEKAIFTDSIYGEFNLKGCERPFKITLRNHESKALSGNIIRFYVYQYEKLSDLSNHIYNKTMAYYNKNTKSKKILFEQKQVIKVNTLNPKRKSKPSKKTREFYKYNIEKGFSNDNLGRDIANANSKLNRLTMIEQAYTLEMLELERKYKKEIKDTLKVSDYKMTKKEFKNANNLVLNYVKDKEYEISKFELFNNLEQPSNLNIFDDFSLEEFDEEEIILVKNTQGDIIKETNIKDNNIQDLTLESIVVAIPTEYDDYFNDFIIETIGQNKRFWERDVIEEWHTLNHREICKSIINIIIRKSRKRSKGIRNRMYKNYAKGEFTFEEYHQKYVEKLLDISDTFIMFLGNLPEKINDKELMVELLMEIINDTNQRDLSEIHFSNYNAIEEINHTNFPVELLDKLEKDLTDLGFGEHVNILKKEDIVIDNTYYV